MGKDEKNQITIRCVSLFIIVALTLSSLGLAGTSIADDGMEEPITTGETTVEGNLTQPNLKVTQLVADRPVIHLNEKARLTLKIANLGNVTALKVTANVTVIVGDTQELIETLDLGALEPKWKGTQFVDWTLIKTLHLGALRPNSEKIRFVDWTPTVTGVHYIKVEIQGEYLNHSSPAELVESPPVILSVGFHVSPLGPPETWGLGRDFPSVITVAEGVRIRDGPLTIEVYDDLVIETGATLILNQDVTLVMMEPNRGIYDIIVDPGATFEINGGGAKTTTLQSPSGNPDFTYAFFNNGTVSFTGATVMYTYGPKDVNNQPAGPGGIQNLPGSTCLIDNCNLIDADTHSLYIDGTADVQVKGAGTVIGSDVDPGAADLLNGHGIFINRARPVIDDITIQYHKQDGIYVQDSNSGENIFALDLEYYSSSCYDSKITSTSGITTPNNPKLAVGNMAHMIWVEAEDAWPNPIRHIKYSRSIDNGITWSGPKTIYSTVSFDYGLPTPAIASDGDYVGIVYIATHAGIERNVILIYSEDNGVTWSKEINLSPLDELNAEDPDIYWQKDTGYIVYKTDPWNIEPGFEYRGIAYRVFHDFPGQIEELFYTDGYGIPKIAVDGIDAHVVFCAPDSPDPLISDKAIYLYGNLASGNWAAPVTLTRYNVDGVVFTQNSFDLIAENEIVYYVWQNYDFGNYNIWYMKGTSTGLSTVWDSPRQLTTAIGNSLNPSCAFDTNMNLHVVWQDDRGGVVNKIRYLRLDNTGVVTVPDTLLTTDTPGASMPSISVDSTDHAYLSWVDIRDGHSEIYYKKPTNLKICRTSIQSNNHGIELSMSNGGIINNNDISSNTDIGIFLGGSSKNTIIDNVISNNNKGISLENRENLVKFVGEVPNDFFGSSVSGAGDVNNDGYDDYIIALIGCDEGGENAGKVCVYSGRSNSIIHEFFGEVAWDYFGMSVSGAGDVNKDGYDDIIIGARENDVGGADAGSAYLYSGLTGSLIHAFRGSGSSSRFGYSVSGAGDVNKDGYDDVVIGASSGRVYIYSGRDNSLLHDYIGEAPSDGFGVSVSGAGDVNKDGYADIIVGAYQPGFDTGKAYVYSGKDWSLIHQLNGYVVEDEFGKSVSGTGDINKDGYDDFIIGAPYNEDGGVIAGQVYVYSGLTGTILYNFVGQPNDRFGIWVSDAGDVNGDGYPDVAACTLYTGKAFVFSGDDGSTLYSLTSGIPGDGFGNPVSGAGDVNNDGYDDLIVGARSDNGNRGAAYIYKLGISLNVESDDNSFYHNNIINNIVQADDGCVNLWDSGYPTGGNYWDDYSGVDTMHGYLQNIAGSDGVGDTPYTNIGGGSGALDKYPLMMPYELTLVSHWKLDETERPIAEDFKGYNDGTIQGSTVIGTPAWIDTGYTFPNDSDGVLIPDDASLNFASGNDFSIFAWIKTTTKTGNYIIYKMNNVGDIGYSLFIDSSGQLVAHLESVTTGTRMVQYPLDIADGNWHHVGLVRNGDILYAYVDNNRVFTSGADGDLTNTNGFYIGNNHMTSNFDGEIDDVKLYNNALSLIEISMLYYVDTDKDGMSNIFEEKYGVPNGGWQDRTIFNDRYGVIIVCDSGGTIFVDDIINAVNFWNSGWLQYQKLQDYGLDDEHIIFAVSKEVLARVNQPGEAYVDHIIQRRDDFGVTPDDIKQDIKDVFDDARSRLISNDGLYLMWIGHGDESDAPGDPTQDDLFPLILDDNNNNPVSTSEADEVELTHEDLGDAGQDYLGVIDSYACLILAFHPCYSGRIIEHIDNPNAIVLTSAGPPNNADPYGWELDRGWVNNYIDGFGGLADYYYDSDTTTYYGADDGEISMYEAYVCGADMVFDWKNQYSLLEDTGFAEDGYWGIWYQDADFNNPPIIGQDGYIAYRTYFGELRLP